MDKKSLKEYLSEIQKITAWFDNQDEIDIEAALEKIRKASELIKLSRERLVEVKNEFQEIKREIGE